MIYEIILKDMENKDKWLESLGDKIEGLEIPEPEGLWNAIEQRLDAEAKNHRPRTAILWIRRASAVAAAIAAIVLVTWIFTTIDTPLIPKSTDEMYGGTQPVGQADRQQPQVTLQPADLPEQPIAEAIPPAPSTLTLSKKSTTADQPVSTGPTPDCTADDLPHDNPGGNDSTYTPADFTPREDIDVKPLIITPRRSEHLALSVYTSGALGQSTGSSAPIDRFGPLRYMVADDAVLENQPLVRSRSVNSLDTRDFDMRHHLPLRVGVKVSYPIWQNIAIETGVSYSRHTSDFSYNGNNSTATGEQELHYIGIPLNVNVGIARWKKFRAYATAGVSAEKLIKGNLKGQVTDWNGNTVTKREDLSEKSLQWTLHATAGLQYDITDHIGLYAEPGLGYHPDNNSTIRNIYKDRPVDFTLTLGLRLTLKRD